MAYSITAGNGSGYFAINSSTGEITLHASGVGNLSGSYVLTRHDDVANTNQQITVNILALTETVDPSHPMSRSYGGQTFTWTPSRRAHVGDFVDGTGWVSYDSTAIMVSSVTPVATTSSVTLYDGTTGSRAINGMMVNPGTYNAGHQTGVQAFDGRGADASPSFYDAAKLVALPLALSVGDRVLWAKSSSVPTKTSGNGWPGNSAAYSYPCLDALYCLTVVASPLTTLHYRPPLYEIGGAPTLVEQISQSAWPTLADPTTPKDLDGNSVTIDATAWAATWDEQPFDDGVAAPYGYNVGCAFSFAGLPTTFQEWAVTKAFTSQTLGKLGYSWLYSLTRAALRTRVDASLSTPQRQRLIDQVIQMGMDYYGWLARKAALQEAGAQGVTYEFTLGPPSGGVQYNLQWLALIAAYLFNGSGETTVANALYGLATADTITIAGNDLTPFSGHQTTINLKPASSSSATTFNSAYAISSVPSDQTMTFAGTVNWGQTSPYKLPHGEAQDRIESYVVGNVFSISGGTAAGPIPFIVTAFTSDGDMTGGTIEFRPLGFPTGGLSHAGINYAAAGAITEITFRAGTSDITAFYAEPVGYSDQQHIADTSVDVPVAATAPWSGGNLGSSYWASAMRAYVARLALQGLSSSLWGNVAAQTTLVPLQRLDRHWEWRRRLGSSALTHGWDINLPQNPPLLALLREYILGDQGAVADAWVVPVVDTAAPTLSSCTGTQTGATTADGSVTTNKIGTVYWGVFPTASTPSKSNIENGTGGRVAGGSISVGAYSGAGTGIGAKTFSITGLTASTAYKVHAFERDAASNESSIAVSSEFTTASAGWTALRTDWANGTDSNAYWYFNEAGSNGKAFIVALRIKFNGSTDFLNWFVNWFGMTASWLVTSGPNRFRWNSANSGGNSPDIDTTMTFNAGDFISILFSCNFANQASDNTKLFLRRNRSGTITDESKTTKNTNDANIVNVKYLMNGSTSNRDFELDGPLGVWAEYLDVTNSTNYEIFFNADGSWKDLEADGRGPADVLSAPLVWTRDNDAAAYNVGTNAGSLGTASKTGYTITDV